MSEDEADKLEKYLAEKDKQDQDKEQESKPPSEYAACVLRESDRVRELLVEAQGRLDND